MSGSDAADGADVVLSSHDDVHHAFRSRSLRQALYDEGGVVMADCLLTLHGDAHRTRRRLENRLFRREMFTRWEREELGATIDAILVPAIDAGEGDLITLGYRITMNLTALVAGIDCPTGTTDETDDLYGFVRTFSEGATLVHSTRDHAVVRAEVQEALEQFDRAFLEPSIRRRRRALEAARADPSADGLVPRDVLTTLLQYGDDLTLTHEIIRREVAFYLQAGSHSTANAFTHTADELFGWIVSHPGRGRGLTDRAGADALTHDDRRFLQRCVHETLRLHPASPVAWRRPTEPTVLASGLELAAGALVVLDIEAANRDPSRWGKDADRFDPDRSVPNGVPPWGHSFGGGAHACIGAEFDGGMEVRSDAGPLDEAHLFGTVEVMVEALLRAGGRPDPERPPWRDPLSTRRHFAGYPVRFGAPTTNEEHADASG